MRKILIMAIMALIIMTSTGSAMIPNIIDVNIAAHRSWETLLINSVEGTKYNVFLISDDAKYEERYLFEKNGIYVGKFYVYIARLGDDTAFLQKDIEPFYTLDKYGNTNNGCYVIISQTGMPDILENVYRMSGGGMYIGTFYTIKNNRLQKIQFINQNRRVDHVNFPIDFREKNPVRYLDDGTFYIHWWANAWPNTGTYKTVYMFDTKNLIMIKAYEYKKGVHDDDYHEI